MAWQVTDPGGKHEQMLVLPRVQPADAAALAYWRQSMGSASRLKHPHLAAVVESGVQDGWPFVLHELGDAATLADRLPPHGLSGREAAALAAQCLQGLAYAHEAGLAHHDLQPFLMLLDERGRLRVAGLAVAQEMATADDPMRASQTLDAAALRSRRLAAEQDVLACGIVLQALLTGLPALPHADILQVLLNLPPQGREPMRLPWTLAQPIAEPLRAIVNRATDRQPRLRYRSARTLL
ncbi:MAG: protein kinase, partial [Pseudomonadota bacterium]|nr:protein kinase [Pseudomonadota bacterium]